VPADPPALAREAPPADEGEAPAPAIIRRGAKAGKKPGDKPPTDDDGAQP
jgi:hypothetical protein